MKNIFCFITGLFTCFLLSAQDVTVNQNDIHASSIAYEEGREYLSSGDPEAAIEFFTSAISLFAFNADYFLARSKAHLQMGNLEEAKKDILEAMEQASGQIDYEHTAGTIYFRLKDYDTALKYYNSALSPGPENEGEIDLSMAYYNRGITLLMLSEFTRAETDFTEAINRNAGFVQAFHNRGIVRRRLKKMAEACADFRRAGDLGNQGSVKYANEVCR